MHPDEELLSSINSAPYFYVTSIREPRDNQLEILIEEAVVNGQKLCEIEPSDATPEIAARLRELALTESTPARAQYRLYWKCYAAYLVTEEMVGSCGNYDDELYEGKHIRVYSKSHFLSHLSRDTGAYSKPLLHYKICCLNHLIDVAAEDPPEIALLVGPSGGVIQ